MEPKNFGLTPLDKEEIPDRPPFPGLSINIDEPELRRKIIEGTLIGTYLTGDLVMSAFRLAELAQRFQGRFSEGFEVPESGKAAAAGAIAISCAALEAALNDMLLTADLIDVDLGQQPESRLIRLSIRLAVDKRLEAIAAICGKLVDWGLEPYQSLALLLSVRKHLLHHEAGLVKPGEGFWPAKKLREVAARVESPYPIEAEIPLAWYVHILNPNGAKWAVNVVSQVLDELDSMRGLLEARVGIRDKSESERSTNETVQTTAKWDE